MKDSVGKTVYLIEYFYGRIWRSEFSLFTLRIHDSFRHPDTALTSSPFKLLTHSIRLSFYEDNLEPKTKKQVLSYNMFFSCLWLSKKSLISI